MSELQWTSPDGVELVGDHHRRPGALVVLLHAGFQNRTVWRHAVGALRASDHGVVACDLRGHGQSGRSPGVRYGVAHHALDLVALREQLDRPASLIGASLGGGTSLAVAGHPDPAVRAWVSALVLVDVTPRLEKGGRQRVRDFVEAHVDGFASMEEAAAEVARYAGGPPRPGKGLTRHLRRCDDGRLRWHWDPRMVTEGFDTYNTDLVEDQLAAARRLDVPTLLLRGSASDVTSPAGVAEFRAAAPRAAHQEVPRAGHMVTAMPTIPLSRPRSPASAPSTCHGWRRDQPDLRRRRTPVNEFPG